MTINSIADLKHDQRNPRKHNPRNLKVIVDSLHDVGFARSIVIDENDEILAGNGVTEAAAIAGIDKVVEVEADGNTIIAVRRRGLTDEQKQRLKYFDNRSGELAEWEPSQLFADMQAGLDLSGMFDEDELDRLTGNTSEVDVDAEWQGMPEFKQENVFGAIASIKVHFGSQAALDKFSELVGQNVNTKTVFIWYPKQADENLKLYQVQDES